MGMYFVCMQGDAEMQLPTMVPDLSEMILGMSVTTSGSEVLVNAEDYYLKPVEMREQAAYVSLFQFSIIVRFLDNFQAYWMHSCSQSFSL